MYTKISVQQSVAQDNLQDRRKNSSSIDPCDPKAIWPFCTPLIHSPAVTPGCPCHSAVSLALRQQSLSRKTGSTSGRAALWPHPAGPALRSCFLVRSSTGQGEVAQESRLSYGSATPNSRVLRLFGSWGIDFNQNHRILEGFGLEETEVKFKL